MSNWNEKAGPDQRWVCGACGRVTEAGATRDTLRDASCMTWGVLCHAMQDVEGRWVAVDPEPACARLKQLEGEP